MNQPEKQRASLNRTLTLSEQERAALSKRLLRPPLPASVRELTDRVVCGRGFAGVVAAVERTKVRREHAGSGA